MLSIPNHAKHIPAGHCLEISTDGDDFAIGNVRPVREALADWWHLLPSCPPTDEGTSYILFLHPDGALLFANTPNRCGCSEEFGDRTINVGRQYFAVCESCRVCWSIGDNLFSGWCEELEELGESNANMRWDRNAGELEQYTFRPAVPQ